MVGSIININFKTAMEVLCKCLSVKGKRHYPLAAYKFLSASSPITEL